MKFMQNKSFTKNILRGIRLRTGKLFHNPYHSVNINPVKKIYYKHLALRGVRIHKLFGKDFFYINSNELLHGLKEIFIDEIYKQPFRPDPYIIDCGANIGLSVIYLKRLSVDAEILAFEPDEKNFELLEKNIKSYGFERISIRKEAIWIENTNLQFAGEGSMSSRIDKAPSRVTTQVKAVRLKDLLTRRVDFLKMDIEGAEFEVIKDIADHLHFVNNLFLEYHGEFRQNPELTELFSILTDKGFSYYIKEATSLYDSPFLKIKNGNSMYDVQLNIFCFRVGHRFDF
jgi:FkbM family methyltransferase